MYDIKNPDVIITAGGTSEPIDDVRYITNFSSGGLGHALAKEYASYGASVLFLAPKLTIQKFGTLPSSVFHQEFMSAESLRQQLLSVEGARIILQAAAVSDYRPVVVADGKISSDTEHMTIELERTPKILPQLRDHFGEETQIVGFKLLSAVEEPVLVSAAIQQLALARTNLCIANDLQELTSTSRRLHIVSPDGEYETISGSTPEVAKKIVQKIYPDYIEELTYETPLFKRIKEATVLDPEEWGYEDPAHQRLMEAVKDEVEEAIVMILKEAGQPVPYSNLMQEVLGGKRLSGFKEMWLLRIVFDLVHSERIQNDSETLSNSSEFSYKEI